MKGKCECNLQSSRSGEVESLEAAAAACGRLSEEDFPLLLPWDDRTITDAILLVLAIWLDPLHVVVLASFSKSLNRRPCGRATRIHLPTRVRLITLTLKRYSGTSSVSLSRLILNCQTLIWKISLLAGTFSGCEPFSETRRRVFDWKEERERASERERKIKCRRACARRKG